jgi:hypothetical protein
MEHKIKTLVEATTHNHTKKLIQTHVKGLFFNEEAKHLVIMVDNAGPLHELEERKEDHHLKAALEKVYGEDITYEIKMHGETPSDKEKQMGREISYSLIKGENDKR